MVLSLGFILAFIGAAVALLIGILIFSEVSDSIICPAGSSSPGNFTSIGGYNNLGSLGDLGDAFYITDEAPDDFVSVTGIMGQAIRNNGTGDGGTNSFVEFGAIPSTWNFMHTGNVGSNVTSINMWVNGDFAGSTAYPLLGSFPMNGAGTGFSSGFESLNTRIVIREDNTQIDSDFGFVSVPDDSNWHMVTMVYDKGNSTGVWGFICVDGSSNCITVETIAVQYDGTATAATFNLTASALKAVSFGIDNSVMNDEVTIWNGWKLTPAEIATMWNGGAGASSAGIAPGPQVLRVTFDDATAFNTVGGSPGSSEQQGFQECENAKDTAWTVIGILPVALFFALFAIFGALGRNN